MRNNDTHKFMNIANQHDLLYFWMEFTKQQWVSEWHHFCCTVYRYIQILSEQWIQTESYSFYIVPQAFHSWSSKRTQPHFSIFHLLQVQCMTCLHWDYCSTLVEAWQLWCNNHMQLSSWSITRTSITFQICPSAMNNHSVACFLVGEDVTECVHCSTSWVFCTICIALFFFMKFSLRKLLPSLVLYYHRFTLL